MDRVDVSEKWFLPRLLWPCERDICDHPLDSCHPNGIWNGKWTGSPKLSSMIFPATSSRIFQLATLDIGEYQTKMRENPKALRPRWSQCQVIQVIQVTCTARVEVFVPFGSRPWHGSSHRSTFSRSVEQWLSRGSLNWMRGYNQQ